VFGNDAPLEGRDLTEAISAEMVDLYTRFYGHDRTSARTFINEDVVVCVLEDILSARETKLVAAGSDKQVIDGRVAFQTDTEDEFTEAVERLTGRAVVGFLSANQTSPGIASELFFLAPTTTSPAGA
jgi:uncharacterized protein YbcI